MGEMDEHFSDWKEVTSGVPQGSVIGLKLFVIFINDIPTLVNHILKLFADDSKLIGFINDLNNQIRLQSDIDALVKWSQDWCMLFNFGKCKEMVITKSNKESKIFPYKFSVGSADSTYRHVINKSSVEKDLGIFVNSNLKFDSHVKEAAKKAYSVLGMLKRTFRYWNEHTFIKLNG